VSALLHLTLLAQVNDALRGESFVADEDEDDPFEGLSPAEIEALIRKEAPEGDAFSGLSPEEINEVLEQERRVREARAAVLTTT
jgi:hypothetical protein